jgi:hypothetical protein
MTFLHEFSGSNFPSTYLVVDVGFTPEHVVPWNLMHLFGDLKLVRESIRPTQLPFAKVGQKKIAGIVAGCGYCFYRWPARVLGESLGDILESGQESGSKVG